MKKGWILLLAIFFLSGMVSGCGVVVRSAHKGITATKNSFLFHQGRHGKLTETEKQWAKIAWQYFVNNTNPKTELTNSVDMYPVTTLWHISDFLAALVAARELNIIKVCEFDQRLSRLLYFFTTMDLAFGKLPNKVYNTNTGNMVDYANQTGEIGWSALDIGRLLIWLKIIKCRYPVYGEYIDKAVLRWNFCDILDGCGSLYGAVKVENKLVTYQEGRLGYEEYAAKGFQLWGFDTTMASKIEPFDKINIHGVDILYDSRDPRLSGTYSPVLSMGFLLDGMEFNWDQAFDGQSMDSRHSDPVMAAIAQSIYDVQEARYLKEHIFTARTDHQVTGPPYFVYDSIFAGGYPWNVISDSGEYHRTQALVSTRACFGMWCLWKTDYTDKLMRLMHCLHNPEKGWYEGRMEQTGRYMELISSGTNAAVLESLFYKARGKLLFCPGQGKARDEASYYHHQTTNPFKAKDRCFPPEKRKCPGS